MSPDLELDGFCWDFLLPDLTSTFASTCQPIFEKHGQKFGIRDVVGHSNDLASLIENNLTPIAQKHLQANAFLVRSTLFDKPADANWAVPWHQDVTIEVQEIYELDGFGPWSVKDGLLSVQPPTDVLAKMLTLRLHFDETNDANGALLVDPGTHKRGKLRIEEINATNPTICSCGIGGVLAMRPLLFHASNRSISSRPRRVLHLDFAYEALSEPLSWRSL